ncbi:8461_t:CDS:1, partial [Diversispora eburnea]
QISRWCQKEEELASAQEKNKCIGTGKKPLYPEAEEKLKKWIIEL